MPVLNMKTQQMERIVQAKQKWDLSFGQIAYLLGLDRNELEQEYDHYLEEKRKKTPLHLTTDIGELGLTTRTTNSLRRNHIDTIGELVLLSEGQINYLKHLGEKGIAEASDAHASVLKKLRMPDGGLTDEN